MISSILIAICVPIVIRFPKLASFVSLNASFNGIPPSRDASLFSAHQHFIGPRSGNTVDHKAVFSLECRDGLLGQKSEIATRFPEITMPRQQALQILDSISVVAEFQQHTW